MACKPSPKTRVFYLTHPKIAATDYQQCVKNLVPSCDTVNQAMSILSKEAIYLSRFPQGYGSKVMENQEFIAQQNQLLKTITDSEERASIETKIKSAQILHLQQMAVIRWLESVN